nr:immunoglobulin light chain junction region [Macaca mulatta]MOY06393.1 immunoglobulin light chain junction region [Macaca mulatta]MOY08904.1 immunoglobulin light chain junction region [Macaca mulatta]MOY09902.1 immunoglobulin light chain junction region [Macaca mulatta]
DYYCLIWHNNAWMF